MKEKAEFYLKYDVPILYVKNHLLLAEIDEEIQRAINQYPMFNSLHEGYAVLLEEVDELWDLVKIKQKYRYDSKANIHRECIQIAAMACRIIIDCEKNDYGK